MKIIYEQDPLANKIILDDHEKELLWYKIKIKQLEDIIAEAHFNLCPGHDEFFEKLAKPKSKETRINEVLSLLNPNYVLNDAEDETKTLAVS